MKLRFHRTEHKKIKLNEQKKEQTDKKQTYRTKEREKRKDKSEAFIQRVWALFLRFGSKKPAGIINAHGLKNQCSNGLLNEPISMRLPSGSAI